MKGCTWIVRRDRMRGNGLHRGLIVLCALLIHGFAGCQLAPTHSWKWPFSKKSEYEVPERILPIWTDTVLHQPGQPGLRGFGGRVFFYKENNPDPIEVEGALAVYVFDADSSDPRSPEPLRKYMFTPEQFMTHMSHSSMGPSYSIWLPWDEVGGDTRNLSIVARFEGTKGGTVISDPTIKLLPGKGKLKSVSTDRTNKGNDPSSDAAVRPANYQEAASEERQEEGLIPNIPGESSKKRRSAETIELPPSFQRHLRNAPTPAAATNNGLPLTTATSPPSVATPSQNGSVTPTLAARYPEEPVRPLPSTSVYDQRSRRHDWRRNPNDPPNAVVDEGNAGVLANGSQGTTIGVESTNSSYARPKMFREDPTRGGTIQQLPKTPRR